MIISAAAMIGLFAQPCSAKGKLLAPVISEISSDGLTAEISWEKADMATAYNYFIYSEDGKKLASKRTSKTSCSFTAEDEGSYIFKIQSVIRADGKTKNASKSVSQSFTLAYPEEDITHKTVNGSKFVLTFNDEFNGNSLDKTKWAYCPEWHRQDLSNYWDDDMTTLDGNGNLVLKMEKSGNKHLSGAIRTKGIFEQAYGYYEIRCKLNKAEGCWTAFWLEGESQLKIGNGGTDGAEIDIMESPHPTESSISQGVIWDGYGPEQRSKGQFYQKDGLYDGYHTFALEWNEDEYIFYVDGEESFRTSEGGACRVPLYVKVSMETGSWTGLPKDTDLPQYMTVDYVRVYQYADKT